MPVPYQEPIRRPPAPEPLPDPLRPRDRNPTDAADLMKIAFLFAPACVIMLSFLWYFCFRSGWISGGMFTLLVLLNFPIAAIGVFAIHAGVRGAASELVRTVYAARDLPPPRAYPRQEVMIARGQYAEAAGHFRDHMVVEPDDNQARLRLAALLETHLDDAPGAEALYKEVRLRMPTPGEETAAANGLIDLYRRTGQRGRLMVELARFAERYRGSAAGEAAQRELAELKRDGES